MGFHLVTSSAETDSTVLILLRNSIVRFLWLLKIWITNHTHVTARPLTNVMMSPTLRIHTPFLFLFFVFRRSPIGWAPAPQDSSFRILADSSRWLSGPVRPQNGQIRLSHRPRSRDRDSWPGRSRQPFRTWDADSRSENDVSLQQEELQGAMEVQRWRY